MAKQDTFHMRFGIRDKLGHKSCIFNLVVGRNDDVYLLERKSGSDIKVSLHESGQNQISFTSSRISKLNIPNQTRHIAKWECPKDSPAFVISIPVSELCESSMVNKTIEWILAPSKGSLTDIFFIFTREGSEINMNHFLQGKMGSSRRLIILKRILLRKRKQNLWIVYRHRKMDEIEFENLTKFRERVINDYRIKNKDVSRLKGTHAIYYGNDANGIRFLFIVGFNELM